MILINAVKIKPPTTHLPLQNIIENQSTFDNQDIHENTRIILMHAHEWNAIADGNFHEPEVHERTAVLVKGLITNRHLIFA